MIKLKPIALAVIGCGLLQGCGMQPPTRQLAVQPVVRGDQPGNQAASWNRLARFHHERGQLALALGAYAQSLALDASQLEARNAVAVIEAQQGNLESSRKALVALVNDFPGEAQPHTNLGYVLHLMGDHAGATRTLRRAMALGAGPKAFQNLQLAEAAMGKAPADDAPRLAEAQVPAPAPAIATAPAVMPAAAPATVEVKVATNAHATDRASPVPSTPMRSEPAPLAAAPLAAAKPAVEVGTIALPAPAEAQRSAPQQLTVLSTAAREVATHMELVKVAANVYELKDRASAAPAVAPAVPVAAAPKPAAQAVPQADKVRMARLEVANGNGVAGMARRFRSLLGQMGIPVDRLSNDKPYQQVATTIQYSPGFERQAASLQKALQGKARLASKPLSASDVRLVLGKDATMTLSAATEAAGLSLIAMHDDGAN